MISVEIEVVSGGFQTISGFAKVLWQHQLNGNGFFEVVVAGSEEDYFVDYVTGLKVKFLKNGVLDMIGVVEKITYTSEGLMRLEGAELGASVYSSVSCSVNTFDSSSVGSIVGVFQSLTGNKVVLGTVDSSSVDKFRTHSSQTCLQALYKLAELEGKDWFFDYVGDSARINVVDKKGSSKVALLNGGVDVGVVTKEVDDSEKVKKVTVVGASYGNNQIIKSAVDGYVLGDAEVTIVDKSIITDANALKRANLELSIRKNSKFNYKFDVVDFNREFVTGDTVELLDKRTNTDAELRIVSVKRLAGGDEEFLELEVRSVGDRERLEDRLRQEIALRSFSENAVSMNQKVDDTALSGTVNTSVNVSGSVGSGKADLGKVGSVGVGFNTSDLGYTAYGYNRSIIGTGGSWQMLSDDCLIGNNDYFFHAAYAYFTFQVRLENSVDGVPSFKSQKFNQVDVYFRLRNKSTGECFPDENGIYVNCDWALIYDFHTHKFPDANSFSMSEHAGLHNHGGYLGIGDDGQHQHISYWTKNGFETSYNENGWTVGRISGSIYIHAPVNWKNCYYVLEYNISNDSFWMEPIPLPGGGSVVVNKISYGYHGCRGHTHPDSISFSDDGHSHSWSGSGSGSGTAVLPNHTHGSL